MKKIYVRPTTDVVNVRLTGSVLDTIDVGGWSERARPENSFGKENNLDFWEDDLWSDGENNTNPYDLWGDN